MQKWMLKDFVTQNIDHSLQFEGDQKLRKLNFDIQTQNIKMHMPGQH